MSERSGSRGTGSEHPGPERISRLLEEPGADPRGRAHLERCDACRLEYERISRMRMALSGLGELEPPAAQWAAIEARLEAVRSGAGTHAAPREREPAGGSGLSSRLGRRTLRVLGSWPLQAAAAVALFAAGILAGLKLPEATPERTAAGEETVGAPVAASAPVPAAGSAYMEALGELDELQGLLPAAASRAGEVDPVAAAERLARLDALILASREAVEREPADPVANGLLFDLVERRDELASELQQSLRLVTLEYR